MGIEQYKGKGKLNFLDKEYEVLIFLDPDQESIITKFPLEESIFQIIIKNKNQKIFEKDYSIKDIEIFLPIGKIYSKELKGLKIKSIIPGTQSIYDSILVRAFGLYKQEIGISTIIFYPTTSIISFNCSWFNDQKSELIYLNSKLIVPSLGFNLNRKFVEINADRDIIIAKSEQLNLLDKQELLYRVLSLLNGGRIVFRTGTWKNYIHINFLKPNLTKSIGPLFPYSDRDKIKIFIEKYCEYELRLNDDSKHKFIMFIEYLLDGLSIRSNIEVALISLYTAMEIIDESQTLDKTSLARTFNIDINLSDFIIRVRNKLIHEGLTVERAIRKSAEEIKNYVQSLRTPFRLSESNNTRLIFNYYFFLVTILYKKIFSLINFKEEKINYENYIK